VIATVERVTLQAGMQVAIFENGKKLDEALVVSYVGPNTNETGCEEVLVKSSNLFPGKESEFAFMEDKRGKQGWVLLYQNPLGSGRCFSQRGSLYDICPM
jgi:hypothetical protein